MFPKKKNPKVDEIRLITLMMATPRQYIEEHLKSNEKIEEAQSGFTDGGRIENNIIILKSYLANKPLVIVSMDFSKAYNSIKGDELIKKMKEFKIDPKIIKLIAALYQGDKT